MSSREAEICHFVILDFKFNCGVRRPINVAYRSYNSSASRTVLIPTCFGQRIDEVINFTDNALQNFHVIVVGALGGGESSSPSNDPDFPSMVDYEDCVNAQHQLVTQHFRLDSLEAILGSSMGAQQAWYWAIIHGSRPQPFVKKIMVVVGSARTTGHCVAFLEGATQAMLCAADYRERVQGISAFAMPTALRAFGSAFCPWTTSCEWYAQECWRTLGCESLQDYLKTKGERAFTDWHPHDLLCLVRMWQRGDIAKLHQSKDLKTCLGEIESEVLVVPSRTDQYFRCQDCVEEAQYLKHGRVEILDTIWGHIGGGGASSDDAAFLARCVAVLLPSKEEL